MFHYTNVQPAEFERSFLVSSSPGFPGDFTPPAVAQPHSIRYEPGPWDLDCCGSCFKNMVIVFATLCIGAAAGVAIDQNVFSSHGFTSQDELSDVDKEISPDLKTPLSVGCYPAIQEEPFEDGGEESVYDWTCAENPHRAFCHMGLPFFRLPLATGESLLDCVTFCMSKMMDLSGISETVSGEQICRCGASKNNYLIWGDEPARANLLPPEELKNQANCSLMMYKTPGKDRFDALRTMMKLTRHDSVYVAGVRIGTHGNNLVEHEHSFASTPPLQPVGGMAEDEMQDERYRTCYPYSCASGGVWTTKQSDLTVPIHYYFSGLGSAAQETFKRAAAEYEKTTCIRFQESRKKPTVRVESANPNSCSASVGYPGSWGEGSLNMGWCNTMGSVGNIMHELGHVLGRTHEQRRPDATHSYLGHGPYLKIHWENVPSDWRAQYTPERSAYVGSSRQSDSDPFHGYMPYDYTSIMSYGPGGVGSGARMTALDPVYQSQMGQRDGLSDSDILTINDMYQCGSEAETKPFGRFHVVALGAAIAMAILLGACLCGALLRR
eukprot:TRINITY_DN4184_c0_g1_i1.p1 TRINITY_DN4184_c0_g1~~TRINITY_DN4184_c0_g1_i1.p1  ORF type:complete len:551 (-),score=81.76 TRINITY_DN4184_c0_g1_i1:19-1671(-)